MESKLISVVIPMYNVEPYIERCVKSVQTGEYRNVEIICIDDGCTDGTAKIVQQLQETDTRIHLYRQQNLGVSAARNYGIKEARGEYIAFVDADDWVTADYLQGMYEIAEEKKADIINCGFWGIHKSIPVNQMVDYTENQIKPIQEKDKYREIVNHVWRALYRRQICPLFNENIHIGEDQVFNIRILSENPSIRAWKCTKRMYYHFWRHDSLFSTAGVERFSYISQAIMSEMSSLPTLRYAAIGALRQAIGFRYCVSSLPEKRKYRDQANALVRKTARLMLNNKDIPLSEKIKHLPFICSARLYQKYRQGK